VIEDLEPIQPGLRTEVEGFAPFLRDDRLVRPWAVPGTPGLEHRIGGIEKQDVTGNVSYDPENHEHMSRIRAERVERVAQDIPPVEPYGDPGGTLMLSWGGTFGAVHAAVAAARSLGIRCGQVHLRWLNPFPSNLAAVLAQYDHVIVPELNLGQLSKLVRAKYLVDAIPFTKIQGQPFKVSELLAKITSLHEPAPVPAREEAVA
jgi:2-oxoglutarate ferredoxin oxidoreductase subunit alpha